MRYQIVKYGENGNFVDTYSFAYRCGECGGVFYGEVFAPQCYYKSVEEIETAYQEELSIAIDNDDSGRAKRLEKNFRQHNIQKLNERETAIRKYDCAIAVEMCPICGQKLNKGKKYFLPKISGFYWASENGIDYSDVEKTLLEEKFKGKSEVDAKVSLLERFFQDEDLAAAKESVENFKDMCDLPVVSKGLAEIGEIKADREKLKDYILHLIHLENNIYFLDEQLSALYVQRLANQRNKIFNKHALSTTLKSRLEEFRDTYQKALKELESAKAYRPVISIDYPAVPVPPVLGKPGLFNKKKVLEENEWLTKNYQVALDAYQKQVRRCDEEKNRLIAEKCATVIGEAQAKADTAKAALDEAENRLDRKLKELGERPNPAEAIQVILDKEIAETEDLLKKSYAARNELYAYDIIFGKYRNVIALSSFYEYLTSGRCMSLEGADGAYNIYENEIRADRVIDRLDAVISSLETIKQNQYMMYQELQSINKSLHHLNRSMEKALTSIQHIEANTTQMSGYLEHISQNSDVIAHNTAVTAYYSKVNAELTNALGYMVAFR
jgi:hypothetical protein